jgi:hypothetical protein
LIAATVVLAYVAYEPFSSGSEEADAMIAVGVHVSSWQCRTQDNNYKEPTKRQCPNLKS